MRSQYIKRPALSCQKEKRFGEGLVSAVKCSGLKVTPVTSVHSALVRMIYLDASNHRGSGDTVLPSSGSKEPEMANSTNGDHKVHSVRKPAPGCWHSRKKTPLGSKLRSRPSSFAIKFEARRGPVMILVGRSRGEVVDRGPSVGKILLPSGDIY